MSSRSIELVSYLTYTFSAKKCQIGKLGCSRISTNKFPASFTAATDPKARPYFGDGLLLYYVL
jgi:hypothetical protein